MSNIPLIIGYWTDKIRILTYLFYKKLRQWDNNKSAWYIRYDYKWRLKSRKRGMSLSFGIVEDNVK